MTEVRSALLGATLVEDYMGTALGIILEGDSAHACDALNRIFSGLWDGDVEEKLAHSLKDCPRTDISLIDRRANSAADYVANIACVSDFSRERGMPLPPALAFILSKDSLPL
ncbi:hypothetical protein KSP40_PGU019970 [Platanthera guangdongensis]|uniref:RNase H type-1 domain-containing protein n=1 Tax=Platanthera guangdongensis TaxID=2320717 RepID=A0ABR2MM48_9ASPA